MSYKGLCIGGVAAGDWVSKDTNSFTECHWVDRGGRFRPPIRENWSPDSLADGTAGNSTSYVHVRGGGGCDYWVPEGKDRTWAMQELVRAYRWINLPPRNDEAID